MQQDLEHLTEWFTSNSLMLNVTKMKSMLFSSKGYLSDILSHKLLVNELDIEWKTLNFRYMVAHYLLLEYHVRMLRKH